ncbi:MAG: hypothetical protein ABMA64_02115 [Myxococcota bacterium]
MIVATLLACEPEPVVHPVEPIGDETVVTPTPDPSGGDPTGDCLTAVLDPGEPVTLSGPDVLLEVADGTFSDWVQLGLCRTDPPDPDARSDGWTLLVDPPLPMRVPVRLAIRTVASSPATALFVPGPADVAVRSLDAQADAFGLGGRVFRAGTSYVADDPRVLEPFQPRPFDVDWLAVLDDTTSMLDEQAKLAKLLVDTLGELDALDVGYRVGAITTDPTEQGALTEVNGVSFVDPATPNRAAMLDALFDVGNLGPVEQGLATTRLATIDAPDPSFLRPHAGLVLLVVSGADDHSTESVPELADQLLGLARPFTAAHAVVHLEGPSAGTRYLQLVERVGGRSIEMDGGDWERFLDDLADDLRIAAGMDTGGADQPAPELWVVPPGDAEPQLCPETYYDPTVPSLACLSTVPAGASLWVLHP